MLTSSDLASPFTILRNQDQKSNQKLEDLQRQQRWKGKWKQHRTLATGVFVIRILLCDYCGVFGLLRFWKKIKFLPTKNAVRDTVFAKQNAVALLNKFYFYHPMIVPAVRVLLRAFTLNRRSAWSRALLPAASKYRVEFGKIQKNCYGIHNSYELTYEELKALYDANDVLIIDVRDPEEIKKQGKIEGSYNIPLGQLSEALKLTPEAFRKHHIKSTAALEIAHKYGYKKSRHYPAGWEEWSKNVTNEP
ncbi:Thiosulfate sulfurtransferase/rhodanese-like domain-containing protein [Trichinella spiralis]|uniref:Thiosulfate sulfurtransferase/rhodanese-like domain-containing protein n=1 Tax=Trichinella spiralis TaxID=6334 RepID=A0ABR3L1H1_TRISP